MFLEYSEAAKANKGQSEVIFTYTVHGDLLYEKLANYLGINSKEVLTNLVLVKQNKEAEKYKFEEEFKKENIGEFLALWK